jgi:hypothetical protein
MPRYLCPFCDKRFADTQKRGSHISSGHRGPDRDRYLKLPLGERVKSVIALNHDQPGAGAKNDLRTVRFLPPGSDAGLHLQQAIEGLRREQARIQAELEILENAQKALERAKSS